MAQSTPHGGGWVWDGRQWIRLQRPSLGRRLGVFLFTMAGWVLASAILLFGVLHIHPRLPGQEVVSASAASRLAPGAKPLPFFGPHSSGGIRSVNVEPNGACSAGGKCGVEVTIAFPILNTPAEFSWGYRFFDPCSGVVTEGPTEKVTAEAGWNRLAQVRTLTLPKAVSGVAIVAVTITPQVVASPPYQAGAVKCK
jgi:hypothetical protein